ncbi:TetR/AcrR family transcriptional regulator, partial [Pseudonocardia sp. NPDC049154]|uniref:TetR/AcrR family transcriptional regulator n=1 Tax=Pseudonocardia sp. NPDC049154 TaxID=3155501 RepID=UPI003406312C
MPHYVSRDDYFEAAIAILSEVGYKGLKMTALHQRLGVTSGSFYNYFRNWPDFVAQFLEHWGGRTDRIAELAAAPGDPLDRLELLRKLARTVPHDAEAAIRVWSTIDPAVAAIQRDVDRRRLTLIRGAVAEIVGADADIDGLARFCLALVVGTQQLGSPVDVEMLDDHLERFIRMVMGGGGGAAHPPPSRPAGPRGR